MPTPCLHSLEQHRARQRQEREAAGTSWKASGYVFTRPDGSPIEGATLTRHSNVLLRRAKLRRIRFHDLRHSAATLLLEQGVELVVIKELLGHAHIGVNATVYAHVRLRIQRDAIDTLSVASTATRETATRTTARPSPDPPSADVAVNYCRQTPQKPHPSHGFGWGFWGAETVEITRNRASAPFPRRCPAHRIARRQLSNSLHA
jgi:hypothetical protein